MGGKRPMLWFGCYFGPDRRGDMGQVAMVAFMVRWDLMRPRLDDGSIVPCVLELGVNYGRTAEARMDRRLDWHVRPWIRSNASEIAIRLANGVE